MKNNFLIITVLFLIGIGCFAQPSQFEKKTPTINSWETTFAAPAFQRALYVQNGINLGASISTPINSANKVAPIGVLIDLNYIYQTRGEIAYGIATGAGIYFEKETDQTWGPLGNGDDFRYIPIAGAVRYPFNIGISGGLDVGYAIGLGPRWDGGFYFRPIIGYNISDILQLNMSYTSISDNWTWSSVNLGLTINLNQGAY